MAQFGNLYLPYGVTLATPLQRFFAACIDIVFIYGSGFFVLFVILVINVFIPTENQFSTIYLTGICLFFILIPFVINLYFLEKEGQTIGKKMMKIKIVDESGAMMSTDRLIMLRQIVPALLFHIPILGLIFFLFDAILIFSNRRQCFHDRIAKTIVVNVHKS
ncbi:RDD family protein [Leptospira yanagawae serovar Saopaulo str. Sao Paulo = ATCC 700523]|uniref:RDD family protein n=1 Tax=Leptospira yanagawae serovar Saopaulo str. Sao Paulo = ATCC 700523 TaxID=1249483 RepID=A0A5E8HJ19_9LEPT|nr:RDD family protein [Leptospira yanagawae]EOQ90500.1 RDD family protein [Leptospira yanagawae serovar Saopaulo str. Sao Paulo = ATCC 700523]